MQLPGVLAFWIPRADILADVAAEDLAAYGGAEFLRDGTALFDGEVGDAAARVHLARRDECVRGAGLDAAAAGAAAVCGGKRQHCRGDLKRSDDAAKKEPRAELLIEGAGVFGGPADAGAAGEIALDERTGIDVAARVECLADAFMERGFERAQTRQEGVVVVGWA